MPCSLVLFVCSLELMLVFKLTNLNSTPHSGLDQAE